MLMWYRVIPFQPENLLTKVLLRLLICSNHDVYAMHAWANALHISQAP